MFYLAEVEKSEEEEGGESDLMQMVGKLVMAMLVKYWIYICGGMFFFVSFAGRIVMYKIIYMMLFLFCVALYQVSRFKHSLNVLKVNIQSCQTSVWLVARSSNHNDVMLAALFIQVHYEWWRRILKYFWMSVVMYTMLVLTLIYTCQFDNSINVWSNMTGMDVEQ